MEGLEPKTVVLEIVTKVDLVLDLERVQVAAEASEGVQTVVES